MNAAPTAVATFAAYAFPDRTVSTTNVSATALLSATAKNAATMVAATNAASVPRTTNASKAPVIAHQTAAAKTVGITAAEGIVEPVSQTRIAKGDYVLRAFPTAWGSNADLMGAVASAASVSRDYSVSAINVAMNVHRTVKASLAAMTGVEVNVEPVPVAMHAPMAPAYVPRTVATKNAVTTAVV
jgi:hypothetical protein